MKLRVWLGLMVGCAACGGGGGTGGTGGAGGSGGQSGCMAQFPSSYLDVCEPAAPQTELARTPCNNPHGILEACATDNSTTPALGCLPNHADGTATPGPVTLAGFVKVFSAGPSSDKIVVQVFRASDLTGPGSLSTVSPLGSFTTDVQRDVQAGTVRACPQADMGTNPPPCVVPQPAACTPACGVSQYCDATTSPGAPTCVQRKRYEARYTFANVPSNTELVIRTSGMGGEADQTWAPLIQYRVIAATSDSLCAGDPAAADVCWKDAQKTTFEASVPVLSRSDYQSIPTTVGLSAGLTAGWGAVAGEVRDCQNVRLEHAAVGYGKVPDRPLPERYAYFNSNPFMTLPVNGKTETDALGLFSGMNLPPGAVRVRAQGRSGGQPKDLGGADAIIFPNSVTIVGINAGRPVNQP